MMVNSIYGDFDLNQIEKYKIRMNLIKPLLPQDIPYKKIEDYIYQALKYYNGYLTAQKQKCQRQQAEITSPLWGRGGEQINSKR